MANQLQSNGYFELGDDEALVLTIDQGNAGYFIVPAYNDWTITDNYWDQQTSLNNAQATPLSQREPDGTYTIVISKKDPGVTNWVSTGGLNQGTIAIRFQDLDPTAGTCPALSTNRWCHSMRREATSRMTRATSPIRSKREQQLALRKAGFNKRWAPYPQP